MRRFSNVERIPPTVSSAIQENFADLPSPVPVTDEIIDLHEPLNDLLIREKLHQAVKHDYIDAFLQPIVTLPQRQTAFYEIFGRVRISSGEYMRAKSYLKCAKEEQLDHHIDISVFTKCLGVFHSILRNVQHHIQCFINITPSLLKNRDYMSMLLDLLRGHRYLARHIVFEMPFRRYMDLSAAEMKLIEGLKALGCQFSADNLTFIPKDIMFFKMRHISFVKIPAHLLADGQSYDMQFQDILNKKSIMARHGITLIAEYIEQESMLTNILDYDIPYGQGYLFGKPDFQSIYL